MATTKNLVVPTDGTTNLKLPTSAQSVQGASGSTVVTAGGASVKNRVFVISVSVDTEGLVTIADVGAGTKVYLPANGTYTWDYTSCGGVKQTTANTAITIAN